MEEYIITVVNKNHTLFIVNQSFSELSKILDFYHYFKTHYKHVYCSFSTNNKTKKNYFQLKYFKSFINYEFEKYGNSEINLNFKIFH